MRIFETRPTDLSNELPCLIGRAYLPGCQQRGNRLVLEPAPSSSGIWRGSCIPTQSARIKRGLPLRHSTSSISSVQRVEKRETGDAVQVVDSVDIAGEESCEVLPEVCLNKQAEYCGFNTCSIPVSRLVKVDMKGYRFPVFRRPSVNEFLEFPRQEPYEKLLLRSSSPAQLLRVKKPTRLSQVPGGLHPSEFIVKQILPEPSRESASMTGEGNGDVASPIDQGFESKPDGDDVCSNGAPSDRPPKHEELLKLLNVVVEGSKVEPKVAEISDKLPCPSVQPSECQPDQTQGIQRRLSSLVKKTVVSPSKCVANKGQLAKSSEGQEQNESSPNRKKKAAEKLLDEPAPRTNISASIEEFIQATDQQWLRARKQLYEHFRGSSEEEQEFKESMTAFKRRRNLDQDRPVAVVLAGNKTVRETLLERGFQECPEGDVEGPNFDFKWTINHGDINFEQLRPGQIVNHFPNSGPEIGTKVGLAKNLRSLQWLDKVDMNRFFPRMYNLANPWEMQDFVEDFVFVASHCEIVRFLQGLPVSASTKAGWEDDKGGRSRRILEAAYHVCGKYLDNKQKLRSLDPTGSVQGVLTMEDYLQLRPDCRTQPEKERESARKGRWDEADDAKMRSDMEAMLQRLQEDHIQLKMDGTRNVWIVKPGHGSRGRGIKCFDDLIAIIKYATSRKKSAIVQKYVENCLLLDDKKFDIRAWVLVSNWNPLTVWMFEPYIRLCTDDHSLEPESLENKFAHLCNRCVQEHSDEYEEEDGEGGTMWSVATLTDYLDANFGDGKELWKKIRAQCMQIALYVMHSCQEAIDNRLGCFEWFGLDFMVDLDFNVWTLECNISPDLSKGTEVLERLVPAAMTSAWDMLLEFPPKEEERDVEHGWDLIYRGKEIKRDVIQKRFWLKKTLLTELRVGRPFSMRDALQVKLGSWTNLFLNTQDRVKVVKKVSLKSKSARRDSTKSKDGSSSDSEADS
mmetsp:Transcript_2139/g.6520  ORF Transcript_2139/g.6520 Transcript_2139/m.6520 type:complete len:964 (+) Transcript_2139:305-3196(+)